MSRANEKAYASNPVIGVPHAGGRSGLINPLIAKAHELYRDHTPEPVDQQQLEVELKLHVARMQILLWAANRLFPIPNVIGTAPENPDGHRGALLLAYSYAILVGLLGAGRAGNCARDVVGFVMEDWLPFFAPEIEAFFNHLNPEDRLMADFEYFFSLSDDEEELLEEDEDDEPPELTFSVEFLDKKITISGCTTSDYEALVRFSSEIADVSPEQFAESWNNHPSALTTSRMVRALLASAESRDDENPDKWISRIGLPSAMLLASAAMGASTDYRKIMSAPSGFDLWSLRLDSPAAAAALNLANKLGERLHNGDWEREGDYRRA